MGLREDLNDKVAGIFGDSWSTWEPREVPDPEDILHGNEAAEFERATVLYADLSSSTRMVDAYNWEFAAEVYKTFLFCATELIKEFGGAITSYDGDRVMGIFISDSQTTDAATCALKINWAVQEVINPVLKTQYPDESFVVKQVVGIDTSPIHAVRTGVRGDNDIAWIGRAANYAAKLTTINHSAVRSWVTKDAFSRIAARAKYKDPTTKLEPMWKAFVWNDFDNKDIYGSTWYWAV